MNYTRFTKSELIDQIKMREENHRRSNNNMKLVIENSKVLVEQKEKIIYKIIERVYSDFFEGICKKAYGGERDCKEGGCSKCVIKHFMEELNEL